MTQTATKMPSLNVRRGRTPGARRFCFYGPESVGKTTLAADMPRPIFVDIEDGSLELDVARYVFDGGEVVPSCYEAVRDAIHQVLKQPHEFETLVLDSVDRLEALIWAYICRRESGKISEYNKRGKQITQIDNFPYGRGYNLAVHEFENLLVDLERVRKQRGMHVVLIGHTHVKTFKNPEGDDYDRYWLRLHPSMAGVLKDWVDVLGFCRFVEGATTEEGARPRGWSSGRRVVKLTRSAAYDAKSRIPMPDEVEMSETSPFGAFAQAMLVGQEANADELIELIELELARLDDAELAVNVRAACETAKRADDTPRLGRFLMDLKNRGRDDAQGEQSE